MDTELDHSRSVEGITARFRELDEKAKALPPPPTPRRRLGKFSISHASLERDWHSCLVIMARVVVVRAEAIWHDFEIEYVAYCDDFDEREDGTTVPEYKALLRREPDGSVTFDHWEKQP